jgi:hypothetical protein
MSPVDTPITSVVMMSVERRPIRSPRWPKRNPPIGRTANPTPNAGGRVAGDEEQLVEHQGDGEAVDEEVVPLQGGADDGRADHLA